jgi:hypothetical protein
MKLPFRCLAALAGFAAVALSAQTRPMRVLFLGNSLTAGNDVPALVQAMAALQGVDLQYTSIAPGGYAIEDHWNDGQHRLIETGNFNIVVLQQGPSTQPASQAHLQQWAVTWANHARRFAVRPALYMVWPVRTQAGGFALVSQSYRNAAVAADAAIFPAGEAWQQAISLNPGVALYQNDDLHAQPAGSFLAAMVIARGLVSLDPARVPATVRGITVSTPVLATFRTVVESLPPSTLNADVSPVPPVPPPSTEGPAVAPSPITPLPAPPATPAAPVSSGVSGGGGGAPSLWFLTALLALCAWRTQRR